RSCLRHHLQSPTLLSTPILNRGEYFREPTRSYQTEVLRESSCNGYDGLPMLPVAPPSPDYIPSLEEPQTPPAPQDEDKHEPMFIQPHDPDFMPEPIYPEYIPLEDEHVLSAEEQPLPPVVSPTAESPKYVIESDPEEDPEEYEDDETENGPVDYLMDEGDDGDDDDGDSSGDDTDDEDEEDKEEKKEHLTPADSAVVIPTDELGAISFPPEAEVERLLAMPTLLPSPLASLSPPSVGERLARCTAPAALPSPPLPPPLHMPPPVDRRDDIPETKMPPRKRLCLSTLGSKYEVRESSTARPTEGRGIDYGFVSTLDAKARRRGIEEVGYGIRDTWVDPTETVLEIAPMTTAEVNTRVTELAEIHEHDTQDLYALLEDAQDSRTRISQRVAVDSQRTDIAELRETDRRHQVQMVETLRVMGDMRREMGDMQAELLALREKPRRAGQPLGDARVPNHQDAPRDADIFQISGCVVENQVKFTTYTLLDVALTWWNSQIRSLGADAYSMTWEVLKKKTTDKYCPQGEIKKLEIELWNLKVKENNVPAYIEHFQELTLICTKFVANETEKIDKYVSGLPDNIYGSVKASKPKTLDETIELANDLMDQKLRTYAERQSNNKRKADDSFRNNHRHFKRDCPKLKNKDEEKVNAPGWVYAVGNIEKRGNASRDPDSNVGTDLMPVEMGSFDVIIGMDWLRRCHAVIVCDEKLVRVPYGNETLTFCGNESNNGRESRLTVISCSKAQEYMAKGCQVFLAQISAEKEEDRSEGKQLEDVPVVQDFPEVFPKDFSGLPPARPVEFQIDLIPRAAPVARAPYRLAPSEIKELSKQLQELSEKGFIRPSSSPWGASVLFVKKKDGSFRMYIDYRLKITQDHVPYEALYGRKFRSSVCWAEVGEAQLTSLELIQETTEKIVLIKQRIQASQDRQKSYADLKWKPMEFEVRDRVMLKVSPWKGVVRFGKLGKLNPKYVGPFKVLAKVGKVAYKLELPQEVHHTFHVSNHKKCYADEPLAMPLEGVHIDDTLQFVEEPVEIMEREIKRLKRSQIPLVKV
nr:putative reverse transcriptase domain-containing protein [Tanacetum cinerariifolium]